MALHKDFPKDPYEILDKVRWFPADENLQEQEVERGASTIPMQLARNLVLSNDKTMERKLKEIIIAVLINTRYKLLVICLHI